MKVLMHACCAPCSIYPLRIMRDEGLTVMGYFYRHNIHPYTECLRRQETLEAFADQQQLKLIVQEGYDLEGFLRNVVHREKDRCRHCYFDRLRSAARVARKGKFDAFTSTLLYSKFQKHDVIREIGAAVGEETGVPFYYQDFRTGWQEGVTVSKREGLYRRPYCGCIYSEKERFFRKNPARRPSPEP